MKRPQGGGRRRAGDREALTAIIFVATSGCTWRRLPPVFGPALRQFTVANSNHRNHTVQTRTLHAYLRWRNKNARHPDVLTAQRKERARVRSEKGLRRGGRPLTNAP
ncbi:transposase [Streptomyces sp. NPDC087908]|uniref:transposase n=1 Tax=Streptomyces sp. NPDC087908 TaxID=3365820 RepID=UPI0037FE34A9